MAATDAIGWIGSSRIEARFTGAHACFLAFEKLAYPVTDGANWLCREADNTRDEQATELRRINIHNIEARDYMLLVGANRFDSALTVKL